MKLVSVEEMQAVEKEADASGFTYEQMMENAGRNLSQAVAGSLSLIGERSVLGLVGSGNNGGDTLVALTALAEMGWKSTAFIVRPRPEEDPLVGRLLQAGGEVLALESSDLKKGSHRLLNVLDQHAALLDGILGTGARLPLKKEVSSALSRVQAVLQEMQSPPYIIAVDVPSGIDCDTGEAAPECLAAELTVTMAAVKQGMLRFPAFNYVGDIEVVGIGLPDGGDQYKAWRSLKRQVVDADMVRAVLPERPADAHKGTFGTALVVAGSVNYTGAVLMAGEAAYRVGAGLVTLAVPQLLHRVLAGQIPEATWLLLPDETGVIAADAAQVIYENLKRATALLFGPGFGMEAATREFVKRLIAPASRSGGMGLIHSGSETAKGSLPGLPPLVADADGLKLLARQPDWFKLLPAPAVLTPHPGEMSILTGLPVEEIQADRIGMAERFAREWGHVVVLKGAFTVVASPDGQTALIPVATAALARAGTGDVLSGLIVGLRAQGVEAFEAAYAGAFIHAQAGLRAADALGNTASVLAGDVLNAVPEVMTELFTE